MNSFCACVHFLNFCQIASQLQTAFGNC
jgi:hypothetical protein